MKLILAKTYGKGEKILLETERLILRELTYDDFKPLYAVLGDSDIMKHYPLRSNLLDNVCFIFSDWCD